MGLYWDIYPTWYDIYVSMGDGPSLWLLRNMIIKLRGLLSGRPQLGTYGTAVFGHTWQWEIQHSSTIHRYLWWCSNWRLHFNGFGLRENLNRKPWFLPSNIGLSCKWVYSVFITAGHINIEWHASTHQCSSGPNPPRLHSTGLDNFLGRSSPLGIGAAPIFS